MREACTAASSSLTAVEHLLDLPLESPIGALPGRNVAFSAVIVSNISSLSAIDCTIAPAEARLAVSSSGEGLEYVIANVGSVAKKSLPLILS